jgi:signal recognition particle GTPase
MNEDQSETSNAKVVADAPHDVMLVLDGSTGQNALNKQNSLLQLPKLVSGYQT